MVDNTQDLELTQFEIELSDQILSIEAPELLILMPKLKITSREFSGVGFFTSFISDAESEKLQKTTSRQVYGALGLIEISGLEHGAGATLFTYGNIIQFLEVYTYGELFPNYLWKSCDFQICKEK